MTFILSGLSSLFSGLGAGAGAAGAVEAGTGAVATAGSTAATGLTIGSVLEGTATVLGLVSSIAAGAAQKDQADALASDQESQQELENLKGISRRTSLKAAAAQALGSQDAAYAASGADLSFGTARQARKQALSDADLALSSDATSQQSMLDRLRTRAANYRQIGKRALLGGIVGGFGNALTGFGRMARRY